MNERCNTVTESHEKTFHWIFQEQQEQKKRKFPSFSQWLHEWKSIYWISGKADSGKSTLMRFLIDHDQTKAYLKQKETDCMILSAFIWNAGSKMQRSRRALLCSLLHQGFTDNKLLCMDLISFQNVSHKLTYSDWSRKDLEAILLEILRLYTKLVCIFIDGLDEIDQRDSNGSSGLLESIQRILLSNIKICVSSRAEPIFEDVLLPFPHLRMQDLTKADIFEYVTSELAKTTYPNYSIELSCEPDDSKSIPEEVATQRKFSLPYDEKMSDKLIKQITWQAEGVFL